MQPSDPTARHAAAVAFIAARVVQRVPYDTDARSRPLERWVEQSPYAYDYQEDGMDFLACYDDNPKKPLAARLAEAVQAYRDRLGTEPNLILVNAHDAGAVYPGCEVTALTRVGVNCYHVGRDDGRAGRAEGLPGAVYRPNE